MTTQATIESLLRELAPQVIARLVRRYGDFDSCEDAVQEALLAATRQWPADGVPDNPQGWLLTVASRRLIEMTRSDAARRRREQTAALLEPPEAEATPSQDDSPTLLLLCCHPSLSLPSQVALTLRAVGGLTTAEIARAFLVPEPTIGQRISRAKQRIKAGGAEFRQDRSQWDKTAIAEGIALITRTLAQGPVGAYQIQAAIAAVHAEASRAEDTDWPQILGLYDLLSAVAPGPMVMLNRIVATAMVHGADAGLRRLAATETEAVLEQRLVSRSQRSPETSAGKP